MLKKTVSYTDYNDNERTETLYFNLSKAEVVEMETSISGGLAGMIDRVVEAQDNPEIMAIFKDLLLKSYGEKSPDGKHFFKEDENGRPLYNKFKQTEAYSKIFMELVTDAKAAADFVNGIIPPADKKGDN